MAHPAGDNQKAGGILGLDFRKSSGTGDVDLKTTQVVGVY